MPKVVRAAAHLKQNHRETASSAGSRLRSSHGDAVEEYRPFQNRPLQDRTRSASSTVASIAPNGYSSERSEQDDTMLRVASEMTCGRQTGCSSVRMAGTLSLASGSASETTAPMSAQTSSRRRVLWQWEHKTGWKDYDPRSNLRIEASFQQGRDSIRVKTGKTGATPMELFFKDMIQYDPTTDNERAIQRLGPDSLLARMRRRALRFWNKLRSVHHGSHKDLSDYKRKRIMNRQHTSKRGLKAIDIDENDKYKRSGFAAWVVRSWTFTLLIAGLIFGNFVWLGLEAEYNRADFIYSAAAWVQVGENFFCACFFLELILRFVAFERKQDCLQDAWWVFDLVLVIVAVAELWAMPLAALAVYGDLRSLSGSGAQSIAIMRFGRLFKLLRIGRSGRALRIFPEVFVQLKAMWQAMKEASWICMMLALFVYTFGIIFVHLAAFELRTDDQEEFKTLTLATWVLMLQGILLDNTTEFLREVDAKFLDYLFIFFICLVGFLLINQLIGVLCSVVAITAMKQKEDLQMAFLKSNLYEIMESHDELGNRTLSQEEFALLMGNPDVHAILTQFGVSEHDFQRMMEILFRDVAHSHGMDSLDPGVHFNVRIPFRDIFGLMSRLKGSNRAKVTDIVDLRTVLTSVINQQQSLFSDHIGKFESHFRTIAGPSEDSSGTSSNAPTSSASSSHSLRAVGSIRGSAVDVPLPPLVETSEVDSPDKVRGPCWATLSPAAQRIGMEGVLDRLHELSDGQKEILGRQKRFQAETEVWRKDMAREHNALSDEVVKLQDRLAYVERAMRSKPRRVGERVYARGWLACKAAPVSVSDAHSAAAVHSCAVAGTAERSLPPC
mmetsp:Transcript_54202/g.129137  ORF Transcript_54202/g.129137 Transcript_54202/m.129137 type:complete len:839 (+) Transcript_54202:110-2626(+)